MDIGPGKIGTKDNAGYFIVLNGLNQQQCRGMLNQVGNQWDYVQVGTGEAAGTYKTHTVQMDIAANGYTPGTTTAGTTTGASLSETGIYRSLAVPTGAGTGGGDNLLTPDLVVHACGKGSDNAIILGSR
ncbi:hypothetical protein LEI94_24890 [Salmonella enterica]|nr:hypothetical protein [Salmonella enterica]